MTTQLKQQAQESRLEFGARLQRLREDRGVTRPALAKSTGIPLKSIEKFEHGTMSPNVERVGLLAAALDTSVDILLTADNAQRAKSSDELNPSSIITALNILADLDQMREEGFQKYWRTAPKLFEQIQLLLEELTTDALLDLAEQRDLLPIDENDYESGMVIERVIDTAYFGIDLFKIELEALTELADDLELEGDQEGWFNTYWSHHDVLLVELRPIVRKNMLEGISVTFTDRDEFPFQETT